MHRLGLLPTPGKIRSYETVITWFRRVLHQDLRAVIHLWNPWQHKHTSQGHLRQDHVFPHLSMDSIHVVIIRKNQQVGRAGVVKVIGKSFIQLDKSIVQDSSSVRA